MLTKNLNEDWTSYRGWCTELRCNICPFFILIKPCVAVQLRETFHLLQRDFWGKK